MEELTIGELARRAGLRTSALRFYKRAGLLAAPRRVAGQRRYTAAALGTLALIQLAQGTGMSLAEIRNLLHGFAADTPPAARWQQVAPQRITALDAQLGRTQEMRGRLTVTLDCRCATLDACAQAMQP